MRQTPRASNVIGAHSVQDKSLNKHNLKLKQRHIFVVLTRIGMWGDFTKLHAQAGVPVHMLEVLDLFMRFLEMLI